MLSFFDLLATKSLQVLSLYFQSLSLDSALSVGRGLGNIAYWFSSRRKVAYADLKAVFGNQLSEKKRIEILHEHYRHLGELFVELLRFPKLDRQTIEKIVKVHYLEGYFDPPAQKNEERSASAGLAQDGRSLAEIEVRRVFKENKGGIFLTAHFGNWEMMQMLPPKVFGVPLHVLARDQKFPRLTQFLNSLRESLGTIVITRGMEMRNLLHSLRRREWVALLGDQDAGKTEGIILPLLGRKTTVPTGPFEFASRTGTSVIPVFVARRSARLSDEMSCDQKISQESEHDIFVGKPVQCRPDSTEDIEKGVRYYISLLERFVKEYPSQWLWETKRWKYSWTKRILILSDGKQGHVKQSQTVAEEMSRIENQYGRPGMEYPTQTLLIAYKSWFHRFLFTWYALWMMPWAQGKMRHLKFFFKPESAQGLEQASADFIISAGSSLVPLNLFLAKDCRAKSVVLMNPSFPFQFFKYDLSVVPAHDEGRIPQEAFRTLLTPSQMDPEKLEQDAQKISRHLRNPSDVRYSVFLGGDTRRFKMKLEDIQKTFQQLKNVSTEGDFLVTTSRRTSDEISNYLKKEMSRDKACQMLVIAKEDARPEVVGGMMSLAEILIVTEDSISMISEALRTGKRVIVLCFDGKGLPTKHRRFREILARESAIVTASVDDLEEKIRGLKNQQTVPVIQNESDALKKRLQAIL